MPQLTSVILIKICHVIRKIIFSTDCLLYYDKQRLLLIILTILSRVKKAVISDGICFWFPAPYPPLLWRNSSIGRNSFSGQSACFALLNWKVMLNLIFPIIVLCAKEAWTWILQESCTVFMHWTSWQRNSDFKQHIC